MADNYLERQYADYEARKAAAKKFGKGVKVLNRVTGSKLNRFYTRPVPGKTHEEQQAEIAEKLAQQK